ncbi:hypothetical protein DSO57_1033222 [Entomophthora muscae]|uniref:Uncharacterized protein n=1 Tax=Entomophthora muscae TaxID=34485 RepID=A0ACC2TYK5_9FUNG|nr:hypothetical protein DSO57_1033222 [Entomophthora muscae]
MVGGCKDPKTGLWVINKIYIWTEKPSQNPAEPLNALGGLVHTIGKRLVLAYPSQVPTVPPWFVTLIIEEALLELDCFLAWEHPLLQQIHPNQPGPIPMLLNLALSLRNLHLQPMATSISNQKLFWKLLTGSPAP